MSFRVEILILIGVVYLIMVGHVCCSCMRGGMIEGLTKHSLAGQNRRINDLTFEKLYKSNKSKSGMSSWWSKLWTSMYGNGYFEGFTGANTNYGQSAPYSLTNGKPVNASNWGMPNLTYQKGKPVNQAVQDILNRAAQPVPLPEFELDMFATTPFKPECCPNTYSNSMGCACMTVPQYNYLIDRGGNNVPYSEY